MHVGTEGIVAEVIALNAHGWSGVRSVRSLLADYSVPLMASQPYPVV